MKIPEEGMQKELIFEALEKFRSRDAAWRKGKVFGYVFDAGREVEGVCKDAYLNFLSENALDFSVFPSVLQMENQIVAMAKNHLQGDSDVAGSFTSGGTESIMLAVKVARDYARAQRPDMGQGEIIIPVTAHAAFHKAAHYLGLKKIAIPVDSTTFKADLQSAKDAITPQTILLVASAPSYAHGVIDPIEEMGQLAMEKKVLFHVDGCIGAFLLPYFKRLGRDLPPFDFSVPGVTSISMDLHKYAYAAKGASVVLYRNKELRKHQFFACSDWTGYTMVNSTIQSSKSAGPLAGAWAVLHYLGEKGYLEIARSLMEATDRILAGLKDFPELRVLGEPKMSLMAITSDKVNVFHIVDEMAQRGWYVQPQLALGPYKENFHLSLNPSNVPHVESLFKDLRESVDSAKDLPSSPLLPHVQQMAGQELGEDELRGLLAMAGLEGGELPDRMAPISEVLNILPPSFRDGLLKIFCNELFQFKE